MVNFTLLARNRFNLTKQALESLCDHTRVIHDVWPLVMDDRSDEPTRHLLTLYGAVRNDQPMGTGQLRNLVVKESESRYGRGDYLYLSDNDVYFTRGWLVRLISLYNAVWDDGFRVLGAYNHPFHQPIGYVEFVTGGHVDEVNALASQSMLMRWSVWDQFGPFVDTPVDKVCQSEDHAFSQKIREAGFKVGVASPALVVNTGITNSFGEHIPGWEMVKAACPQGVLCE